MPVTRDEKALLFHKVAEQLLFHINKHPRISTSALTNLVKQDPAFVYEILMHLKSVSDIVSCGEHRRRRWVLTEDGKRRFESLLIQKEVRNLVGRDSELFFRVICKYPEVQSENISKTDYGFSINSSKMKTGESNFFYYNGYFFKFVKHQDGTVDVIEGY